KLARILAQRERRFSTAYTILREIKEKLFLIEKWCWRLSPAPALSTVCGSGFYPDPFFKLKSKI
ncbi:MAG: hypothetical protein MRZ74_07395, partial [Blautia sp.]|nr:hypothetical protein [Blautia sp.]